MRTTLNIDDDILAAARRLATAEHKGLGEVISALARHALQPAATPPRTRNGIPLLPVRFGTPSVTAELVKHFLDHLE